MKTRLNKEYRPKFIKIFPIAALLFISLIQLSGFNMPFSETRMIDEGEKITINPEFKFKRLSNGTVEMYRIKDKNQKKYRFTDFNADLLLSAYRRMNSDQIISVLSKKYNLSKDECRRQMKHSLNILEDWGIVLKNGELVSH